MSSQLKKDKEKADGLFHRLYMKKEVIYEKEVVVLLTMVKV